MFYLQGVKWTCGQHICTRICSQVDMCGINMETFVIVVGHEFLDDRPNKGCITLLRTIFFTKSFDYQV